MKILQDIATAVRLTGEVRKARKTGASGVQVKPVYTVPAVRFGYWGFTMEGCLFYGPKWQPLRDVFSIGLHLPQRLESGATVYVSGSRNSATPWSRICTTK